MIDLQKTCEFIAGWESFEAQPYDDGFGNMTIGYGETDAKTLKKYKNGITQEQAWALLQARVQGFADDIAAGFTREPTLNQHGAFTSLSYNIGVGGFLESTALRRFNEGDIAGAAVALKWWNKVDGEVVQGLVNRRDKEYDWFLSPEIIPVPHPPPPDVSLQQAVALISMNSGLALDVEEGSLNPASKLMQFPLHGEANQRFVFTPFPKAEAGIVAIVAVHSGQVLDVTGWSTENGAEISQYPYHGGENQQWRLESVGPNCYKITSVLSGKCLDIRGVSVDPGARLTQWDWTDSPNQKWFRVRMLGDADVPLIVAPPEPPPEDNQPPPPPPPPENFDVGAALRGMGFPSGDEEDVYGFQGGFSFYDISLDGQAGPQTIAAIRYAQERGGRCGEYFTFSEFGCKHCGRPRIWREHVRALDKYRAHVGPVTIISGTRCDQHNLNVGGASNSQHRPYPNNRGVSMATDIPGVLHVDDMLALGFFSGVGYVGADGMVVHVDSRGDGPNNTTGGSKDNATTWAYR